MSHRIAAKITGVAGYVPPKVLTNADLEKMVETNDEWIRTRTGIRERRIAGAGTASSHLVGIRFVGGMLGICLCANGRCAVRRFRCAPQGIGDWQRRDEFDFGL